LIGEYVGITPPFGAFFRSLDHTTFAY
jgi:hypothetical protein